MDLANVTQTIFLVKWTTVVYLILTGGTINACLWLLRTQRSSGQTRSGRPRPSPQRGAPLRQVYPTEDDPEDDGRGTDIDIIAIHGLDTNSEKTWTWRGNGCKVNWLADPDMLPSRVKRVRIFTYDWPADLMQPSDLVQKTQGEFAILLFEEIRSRIRATGEHARNEDRPIFFIASCLGGIILMKALVGAGATYQSVRRATRGIVFLATPFRGTSFQDVANLAEPGLNAWARIRGREVINLLTIVKEPTLDLVKLVQDFTALCKDKDYPCHVSTFYEKGKTSLPRKVFPWLPAWLRQEKLLVDESSAALDIVPQPLPLSRPHILMNKFAHSECTEECKKDCTESEDFGRVAGKIAEMLQTIRKGSPLEQADAWIRTNHYTADRLKIERLSGDLLPLERCYINLAVVQETKARHTEERPGEDAAPRTSPFSLAARLKVETPDKNIQVDLPSLFDPRKGSDGQPTQPRRILIRGRAGVGKTTLCKKMVHDFINRGTWKGLFDRVLWVPLRRLKGWSATQYDLEELFSHEYFSQQNRSTRKALAEGLRRVVEKGRTLFILDGVDEISQHLDDNDPKSDFLQHLLNLPSVIITTRPHVSLPTRIHPLDLDLETIGFYPGQVKEYLQATFEDMEKVEDVQSYLQTHQLIQGLVRIPIQLDALCYTWENFNGKAAPQTMTAMYRAIEENLWKKDIVRLEKRTQSQTRIARRPEVSRSVDDEVYLLEMLAFTGLHDDVIDYEPRHRDAICGQLNYSGTDRLLDETLGHLSFLRPSDTSSNDRDRNYHFLHLTFQEYFAARYFVRQWKAEQRLKCLQLGGRECEETKPATFLQTYKYDPRYDIFWRFVAGLLDADKEALGFFQAVESEPRDLLGPTHQRLVMHCLSEVERKESPFTGLRTKLEGQLVQWLLFECSFARSSDLALEMECPEQALVNALQQAPEDTRPILLESLDIRATVPYSVIDVASPWLNDCASSRLCIAILKILRHQHRALPETILRDVVVRLEDDDSGVREAAIKALQGRTDLIEEMVQGIAARLEDDDSGVQWAAIKALRGRIDLTEEMVQGITARLEHNDSGVRWAAIKALQDRTNLTEEMVQGIAARLEHNDSGVRCAAIEALQDRTNLTEEMVQNIAARLEDNDSVVRRAAIEALQGRTNLTEEMVQGIAARLEDNDSVVRRAAIEALRGRTDLTEEMVQGITARLEHNDSGVRWAAIKALQDRIDLTEEMVQGITARLEDNDSGVRWAAIKALQDRTNLTEEMVQGIAARLEDDDSGVRWAAIEALQDRTNLTEEMVQNIAARLEDNDSVVRRAAIEALQGRTDLTEEMVQGIAARLEDNDYVVRWVAIEALQGRTDLTEEMVQGIAARLEDNDYVVREAAIKALRGRTDLIEEMVQGIAARLEDNDSVVRRAAIKALQGRTDLTEEMVQGIAARLEDNHYVVREAATWALTDQEWLSLEFLSPYLKPLYQALLQRSFAEHLYWYASDDFFIGVGPRHVFLSSKQGSQPRDEIREIRNNLGVPVPYS